MFDDIVQGISSLLGQSTNYECVSGVCRPKDNQTRKEFKRLQNNINLVLGSKSVKVDGIIGPNTLEGFRRAANRVEHSITASFSSPERLARNASGLADELGKHIRKVAKERNIPQAVVQSAEGGFPWKKVLIPAGILGIIYYISKKK